MAHLGIGATQGLMSVVSLPRYFMFRVRMDDPHPFPWIRVALSLAFGERLFPNEQWALMRQLWHRLYPKVGLNAETARIVASLEGCTPAFVELVITHRNAKTGNQPLASLFPIAARQPPKLRQLYQHWQKQPEQLPLSMPSLVFAAVGQARADSQITAPNESRLLGNVLTQWAWMRAESRPQRTSSPRLLRAALQTFIQ